MHWQNQVTKLHSNQISERLGITRGHITASGIITQIFTAGIIGIIGNVGECSASNLPAFLSSICSVFRT
jgi:hypothetical protein